MPRGSQESSASAVIGEAVMANSIAIEILCKLIVMILYRAMRLIQKVLTHILLFGLGLGVRSLADQCDFFQAAFAFTDDKVGSDFVAGLQILNLL